MLFINRSCLKLLTMPKIVLFALLFVPPACRSVFDTQAGTRINSAAIMLPAGHACLPGKTCFGRQAGVLASIRPKMSDF